MIGEAVTELRDSGPAERPEVRVELPVNAHIPHEYVPGERLRLEAYTRIAAADSDGDIAAVHAELTDRYGPPPEPVLGRAVVGLERERCRVTHPARQRRPHRLLQCRRDEQIGGRARTAVQVLIATANRQVNLA